MAKYKIVFTDTLLSNLDLERQEFAKIDAEVFLASATDPETLKREAADCDALFVEFAQLTRDVISALTKCKVVVRTAIGYDNIDVPALTEKGIMFANVPDYCVDEVSDHTIALIMACCRKITALDRQVKAGGWDESVARPMRRLKNLTLGIYGYGKIARMVAAKANAIGFHVQALDPFVPAEAMAAEHVTAVADKNTLLESSDVLAMHVPLLESTKNCMDAEAFSHMKQTAYFINTSRGGLMDMDALYQALKEGKLAGAAFDVTPEEPPCLSDPIFAMDNVIVTPHIAYYSEEAEMDLRMKAIENAVLALTQGAPKYYVNRPK